MNEVEIRVTAENDTAAGFRSAEQDAKKHSNSIKDLFSRSGADSAAGFGLQFSQRLGPLIAKTPVGPGLAAAVAAAGPALNAALTTAVTVGAAGGAVALGAALSAKDPRVAGGIASLKAHLGSELRISARPFVPAMLESIDKAKASVRTLRPELDAVFAKSSTYLDPLTEGAIGFVRNALPGIRSLVDAAEPLVDILGEELPELGEDLAKLFDDVGDSASRNQEEFRAILDTTGLIVRHIGSMTTLMDYLAAGPTRTFLDLISDSGEAIEGAQWVDPIKETTQAFEDQNEALKEARDLANEFADALGRITDQNLSAAEANLEYRETLTDVAKAIDDKTAVSRKEEAALYDLARAGNDVIATLEDTGASSDELADKQAQLRADFIRSAQQMGINKTRAEQLADQYLAIPRNVRTNVQANTDDARRRVIEYRNLLASVRRNITTSFNVDTNGNAQYFRGLAHGGISSAANGGLRSGMTWVGEYGPELVRLAPGSHVMSNADSMRNSRERNFASELLSFLSSGGPGVFYEDISFKGMREKDDNTRFAVWKAVEQAVGDIRIGGDRQSDWQERAIRGLQQYLRDTSSSSYGGGAYQGMGGGSGNVIQVQPVPGSSERLMNAIIQELIWAVRTQGNGDPQSFLSGGRAR